MSERYLRDLLQVISGHKDVESLLAYYPPECTQDWTSKDKIELSDSIASSRIRFPLLRDIEIDGIEFVGVHYEPVLGGIRVIPTSINVIANGMREDAVVYFERIGLRETSSSSTSSDLTDGGWVVKKQDGRIFVDFGTCEVDPFRA